MQDKPIVLSHEDSYRWSEVMNDEEAAKLSLRIAMQHHENTIHSITQTKRKLWEHLYEVYGLDPDKHYKIVYSLKERRYELYELGSREQER